MAGPNAHHPTKASSTHSPAAHDSDLDADDADWPAIQASDVARANGDLRARRTDVATLAGFEPEELEALYGAALEQLRLGMLPRAIGEFLALVAIRPSDARFVRGLGLCYHAQRSWGFAASAYSIALGHDADDGVSMVLLGECLLYLQGKHVAHSALTQALARGVRRPHEAPYMDRAQALLTAIRL